jgi:hypothetical protein
MFQKTPGNLKKLKALARDLGATVLKPFYPVSDLYRVSRDADGMQLDFMARIDGIRSYRGLRSRSVPVRFGAHAVRVASLEDIIRSKSAADRPQDRAVIPVLEATLREKTKGS